MDSNTSARAPTRESKSQMIVRIMYELCGNDPDMWIAHGVMPPANMQSDKSKLVENRKLNYC